MNASLNEKLRNVKWGEYRIGDLFQKIETKKLPYKAEELPNRPKGKYILPCLTSSFNNQGLNYYAPQGEATVLKNVISIPSNSDVYRAYYQSREFTVLSDAYAIRWSLDNREITANQYLFMVMSINKVTDLSIYSYKNKLGGWNAVKDKYIQLPQNNGEIDYAFMDSFIAELSAYLTVSGLDNYKLSIEEEIALRDYNNQVFDEFDITSVFNIRNTSNILAEQIVEGSGSTPYLCASSENNAVSSYINYDEKYLEQGHCIFIGGKTFVVTYQEKDFFSNDSHNLSLHLKGYEVSKLEYLYLATCVYRSLSYKYSWGNSVSRTKIKTDGIYLPVKDGKPDYQSMELLISAIQKIVIKDVVQYTDRKIAAADKIVKGDKQNDGVSPAGQVPDMEQQSSNLIYLPIVGEIAAGHEHFAEDDILGEIGVEPSRLHPKTPGKHFFLRVSGDSMIGAGIYDGDNVLIRRMSNPRADVRNGDVVACQIHGENATLKTFYREHDHVRLKPENEEYEEYIIPNIDFETGEARIIGKCMGIWPGDEARRTETEVSEGGIKKDVFSFLIYVIHACANEWRTTPKKVYKALKSSGCIRGYLVPHYDILHTQGTDYLVDDIHRYLELRGVTV